MKTQTNPKSPVDQLENMIVLAATRHSGQRDKGGLPYVLHPLKVSHYLKTTDLELMVIAIGHDLVEDTETTYAELLELGFSPRVVNGIRCLTKVKGETYEEYKKKVKSNRDSILVKMCDLRHNTDIRRLKGVTQKDLERVQKYHEFYLELCADLNGVTPTPDPE